MCTNYRAPDGDATIEGFAHLKLGLDDLWRRKEWRTDVWPDYDAPAVLPVVLPDGRGATAELGTYGFWPEFLQPVRVNPATGRKLRPYTTVNARAEEVGVKPLYKAAWRAGQRCLIPCNYVVEPSYPFARLDAGGKWINGKCVWQKIGLKGWEQFCVAGIWKRYETARGPVLGISMLTLNADDHELMRQMHKPGDEKRSVVILHPEDYDAWLHTSNVEEARAMLQLWPAAEMEAAPAHT